MQKPASPYRGSCDDLVQPPPAPELPDWYKAELEWRALDTYTDVLMMLSIWLVVAAATMATVVVIKNW
jgi:hypothetical protein